MARDFDGAQNVINVADDSTLDITNQMTIALWFQYTAPVLQFDALLMKASNSSWIDGFGLYQDLVDIAFFADDFADSARITLSPSDTNLHHVVGRYDNVDNQIFLDGTQGTDDAKAPPIATNNATMQIGKGRAPAATTYTIPAMISYVAVWNTDIPDRYIEALNRGAHPFAMAPDNLVALLPLYGNASPELDESANGNTGTVTGAVKAVNPPTELIENYI